MISFALFSVLAYTDEHRQFELTAVDLSFDGFTFRLVPEDTKHLFPRGPASLSGLQLIHRSLSGTHELALSSFTITEEEKTPCFTLFRLVSEEPELHTFLRRVMKDLLTYEDLKNNRSDADLTGFYTGYPVDAEAIHFNDFESRRQAFFRGLHPDPDWFRIFSAFSHMAWCLSSPEILKEFLHTEPSLFFEHCLQRLGLQDHPLARRMPDTILLGNAFCPGLLPDPDTLTKLWETCLRNGLRPVLHLPPLSEDDIEPVKKLLTVLPRGARLMVNDAGLAADLSVQDPERFHLMAGPLLVRRRADPRISFWTGDPALLRETSADSASFQGWLASLGIWGSARESCGYPLSTEKATCLFLPFYRVATATRCTLPAVLSTGNRSFLPENTACHRECEKACLLYGDGINMVGRFNSLFGFDRDILESSKRLQDLRSGSLSLIAFEFLF